MRALATTTLVFLLAVLLAGSSPSGTGRGAHHDQLLDLLIPHYHPVVSPFGVHAYSGPVLGAESGSSMTPLGIPLTPLPPVIVSNQTIGIDYRWIPTVRLSPAGRTEAPPDPPPNAA